MRLECLFEKRREPEKNPKENVFDILKQYKDDPNIYIHTSSVSKLGINPKTNPSLDTPAGIYAFRLGDIWSSIELAIENNKSLGFSLPYYGGEHLFIFTTKEPMPIDSLKDYSKSDLERDLNKIQERFNFEDETMDRLVSIATTNENFVNAPIGIIWGITKSLAAGMASELSHQVYPDPIKWNSLLRFLGIEALNDVGYGFIHGAERTQALFLSKKIIDVKEYVYLNRKQPEITIGGKEYKGGRFPKELNLRQVDDTELSNLGFSDSEKYLKRVHTINLKSGKYRDLKVLKSYFPNAHINIENYRIEENRMGSMFKESLEQLADGRVSVENLLIINEMPLLDSEKELLQMMLKNIDNILLGPMLQDQARRMPEGRFEELYGIDVVSKIRNL